MGDPYGVVHDEVQGQLADAGTAILRWRQASKADRDAAGKEVLRILDEVAVDLADLEEMVAIAPSPADSRARAAFLHESQRSCRELRDEVQGRSGHGDPAVAAPSKDRKDRAELLRSDGAHAHAAVALPPRDAPMQAVLQQQMTTQREEVRRRPPLCFPVFLYPGLGLRPSRLHFNHCLGPALVFFKSLPALPGCPGEARRQPPLFRFVSFRCCL